MTARKITLTRDLRAAIEQHALETSPGECCGLLGGKNKVITTRYPLRNSADNPETRYAAAPEELFAAMRRMREANEDLLGIYHSHPRTAAYPSATDIELAFYPEAVYFIISLRSEIEIRAFKITDALVEEVEILTIHHL